MQKALYRMNGKNMAIGERRKEERLKNREAAAQQQWKETNPLNIKKLKRSEAKTIKNNMRLQQRRENRELLNQEENALSKTDSL